MFRRLKMIALLLGAAISGAVPGALTAQGVQAESAEQAEAPLTNDDLLALAMAGVSDEVIIHKIKQAPREDLDSSTEGILALTDAGVSQAVIQAVLDRVREPADASLSSDNSALGRSDPEETHGRDFPGRSTSPKDPSQSRIEIVLDASGSMRGASGNQTKMEAAVGAIESTIGAMTRKDQLVALRAYGHRLPREPKAESCGDSELLIPFMRLDKQRFSQELTTLRPSGQTPLAYSLELAAADFGRSQGANDVIILISDGNETCGGDPAAVACQLARQGLQLTVHTIGFDVDQGTSEQLRSIARCTGGQYQDAGNAEELVESFERIPEVAWAPDFGFQGFEVRAGITSPSDYDSGLILGASLDWGEFFYDNLRLYPSVFYSTAEVTNFGLDYSIDVIGVGADLRYFRESDLRGWYFGAGPYVHSSSLSGPTVVAPTPFSAGVSSLGIVGVTGYNFGALGVEARVNTGFKYFSVLGTYRFGESAR